MTYLFLTDQITNLGKKQENFKIQFVASNKPVVYVPAEKVEGILVESKITITHGAFALIQTYTIPVIWPSFASDGLFLQPHKTLGNVDLRRAQYAAYSSPIGTQLAVVFIQSAAQNKLAVLKRIQRNYSVTELNPIIDELKSINLKSINVYIYQPLDSLIRNELMSFEANFAKIYLRGLRIVLNTKGWDFPERSRRPAQDNFNALLNYAYAILKGKILDLVTMTGLDQYAGFLHTDRSGRESLILDLIEEFRPAVDELLIKLIVREKLGNQIAPTNGVQLTKEQKKVLINTLFEYFSTPVNGKIFYQYIMQQARSVALFLREKTDKYINYQIKVKDAW